MKEERLRVPPRVRRGEKRTTIKDNRVRPAQRLCLVSTLFRALQSDMPLEVKAEVVHKVNMVESSMDDNQKLITWKILSF